MDVVGIDNDMRREFFGPEASTAWNRSRLEKALGRRYRHHAVDIRDRQAVDEIFARHGDGDRAGRSTPPRNPRTTGRRRSP